MLAIEKAAHEHEPGVIVLRLSGVAGERSAEQLRKALSAALEDAPRCVVLNLSGLRQMSSASLGRLVAAIKRLREAGGQLVLCGARPPVSDALRLLHLDEIVPLYPSEEEALRALGGQRD